MSTTFVTSFKNQLKNNPVFRPLLSGWFGTKFATDLYVRKVVSPYLSILRTGEFHNFTYDLTPTNLNYLCDDLCGDRQKPGRNQCLHG